MYGQQNGYYMPNYNPYMMQNNGAMPDMLNSAKMQYQQPISQQQMQIPQMNVQIPKTSEPVIWVLNENEAVSYPVAPNNSVVLWDKSNPTIYVKSANAQGVPSIRILDFVERSETAQKSPTTHVCKCKEDYIDKKQFAELEAKFNELSAKFESLAEKPKTTAKKTKGDDE